MIETDAVLEQASRLKAAGKPFVLATVVRVEAPTSAKPGAKAIVTPDGRIDGWIGGGCAQPAVIKTAKQAMHDGQSRLIRISPEHSDAPETGVIDFGMTCYSGGTLDIFLEPVIARPLLLIIGASPAGQALSGLAPRVGFTVIAAFPGADKDLFPDAHTIVNHFEDLTLPTDTLAFVVVATQGKRDEEGLEAALGTGAEYIAFIASERKAQKLKDYLRERGHDPARIDVIQSPAGLAIGAVTPEEIALSVLADVVKARRHGLGAVIPVPAKKSKKAARVTASETENAEPAQAIDPVCGMTVATAGAAHRSQYDSRYYYFCCAHCQHRFEKEPQKYLAAMAS